MDSQQQIPLPAQQQSKSVEATARSFFKGGMGIALQNFAHSMSVNQRNVNRFQDKLEGKKMPEINEPLKGGSDDMRIDSDDIHYHMLPPATTVPEASAMSTLAKIGVGLAVGGPIGAGIAAIPAITQWLNPPAVVQPAEPKTDAPAVNIGGTAYELSLEPE